MKRNFGVGKADSLNSAGLPIRNLLGWLHLTYLITDNKQKLEPKLIKTAKQSVFFFCFFFFFAIKCQMLKSLLARRKAPKAWMLLHKSRESYAPFGLLRCLSPVLFHFSQSLQTPRVKTAPVRSTKSGPSGIVEHKS